MTSQRVIEEAAAEVPGFDVAAFWEHWRLDPGVSGRTGGWTDGPRRA